MFGIGIRALSCVGLMLALAACGADTTTMMGNDAATSDSSVGDAGDAGSTPTDTGVDMPAPLDSGADLGEPTDAALDMAELTDAETDMAAPFDASVDADVDAGPSPCEANPCMNGGTCEVDGTGFACTCVEGYSGTTCETNVDDCSPNPCERDGECADGIASFMCACSAEYAGATCSTCADDYQDNDHDGICTPACGAPGVCGDSIACNDFTGTAICDVCPISAGAMLAWEITPPVMSAWTMEGSVVYVTDNRASLASTAWTRIAYCMILDSDIAYAEMNDFTTHQINHTALPTDWSYNVDLSTLTVRSNASGVDSVEGSALGAIEFWSSCYSPGDDPVYDYNDHEDDPDCYGSFQVSNGINMVMSFNRWARGDAENDIGFGNQPVGGTNPDWTFAGNASLFATRRIRAYVLP